VRVPRKPVVRLPKERCFFPTMRTDGFARVRAAIAKRFEVTDETATSVSFRCPSRFEPGVAVPTFRLEVSDSRRFTYTCAPSRGGS
jgi:hypothetical protein